MIGTANGYAAYQKGMFIPIASTFFMFWLYAAPAVRMSALQGLRFIGIATHDSIGIGEDGMSRIELHVVSIAKHSPCFQVLPTSRLPWVLSTEVCQTSISFALQMPKK
jgi:dihydroxyacetone synthase